MWIRPPPGRRRDRSVGRTSSVGSVGSVGDALDNALAETTVESFKNELIRRQGPWRDVDHVELGTAQWVAWFNTERPHEHLDGGE
jgi:putative transposase